MVAQAPMTQNILDIQVATPETTKKIHYTRLGDRDRKCAKLLRS